MGEDRGHGSAAFARALDAAIRERGVSLSWLHRRLRDEGVPVSLATLSYWRSGRSEPQRRTSLDALHRLEDLLALPRGGLTSALSPVRRPGPPSRREPLEQLSGYEGELTAALAELGFHTAHDEVVEEEVVLTSDLDERGRLVRATCQLVVKAVVDGASRAVVVFGQEPDATGRHPRIEVVSGCRQGRSVAGPAGTFVLTELLLHAPLAKGETAIYELEGTYDGDGEPEADMDYFAETRIPGVAIWVRFHPGRLPAACTAYTAVGGEEVRRPVTLAGNTAHVRARQFGPGTIGLRWTWD